MQLTCCPQYCPPAHAVPCCLWCHGVPCLKYPCPELCNKHCMVGSPLQSSCVASCTAFCCAVLHGVVMQGAALPCCAASCITARCCAVVHCYAVLCSYTFPASCLVLSITSENCMLSQASKVVGPYQHLPEASLSWTHRAQSLLGKKCKLVQYHLWPKADKFHSFVWSCHIFLISYCSVP